MVYRFLAMGVLSCVTMLTATPQRSYGQAVNSEVALTGAQQTVKPGPRIDVSKSTVSGNVPNQSILKDVPYNASSPTISIGGRTTREKRIKKWGKISNRNFIPRIRQKWKRLLCVLQRQDHRNRPEWRHEMAYATAGQD